MSADEEDLSFLDDEDEAADDELDFLLDEADEDEDDFAEVDAMLAEAEPEDPNAVDLGKPLCSSCGYGQAIPGPVKRSRCQKCDKPWAWDQVEEVAPPKKAKDGEPNPIITGHCAFPQTQDPHLSHQRCRDWGSGSRANPERRFHPCPCACHLKHDTDAEDAKQNRDGTYGPVDVYECAGCGGHIVEAPVLGTDADGDPIYVHFDSKKQRMIYVACR